MPSPELRYHFWTNEMAHIITYFSGTMLTDITKVNINTFWTSHFLLIDNIFEIGAIVGRTENTSSYDFCPVKLHLNRIKINSNIYHPGGLKDHAYTVGARRKWQTLYAVTLCEDKRGIAIWMINRRCGYNYKPSQILNFLDLILKNANL